jgi:hypothetical protein
MSLSNWKETPCTIGGKYSIRKIWVRRFGVLPEGIEVLHYCDNPFCKNLEHIWLGTQSENLIDMVEKERHSKTRLEETKKAISLSKVGNQNWQGLHHSEESKKKISEGVSKVRKGQTRWWKKYVSQEDADVPF